MKIATNSHCSVLIYCSLWDREKKEGEGREESGERERTEEGRKGGRKVSENQLGIATWNSMCSQKLQHSRLNEWFAV